jgi:hypothetical protein
MQKKNEREESGPGDNGKIIIMARWRVVSEMQKAEKHCLWARARVRQEKLGQRVYTCAVC